MVEIIETYIVQCDECGYVGESCSFNYAADMRDAHVCPVITKKTLDKPQEV